LELSAIMTFGVLAILTLSTSLAWRERARLIAENERLQQQVAAASNGQLARKY
jgi:Mg2+/citrate symporter